MLSVSAILSGATRAMSDVAAGAAKTTGTIGATTDDFVRIFGNGGVDGSGLRNSLDPTNANLDDTALRSMLGGSGTIDDAAFNKAKTAREYFLKRREAGKYDTAESFEAVSRNIDDTGSALGGYSAAGQTRSESFLTNIFGTGDRSIGGELGFLAASGAIGGGVNYMAGGEFGSGAGVGMLAGTGIRGAGRLVQNSMGDIETSMMKRLLGESEYGKLAPKDPVKGEEAVPATPDVFLSNKSGKTVQDLINEGYGDLTLTQLGFNTNGKDFGRKSIDQALSLKAFLNSRQASYAKKIKGGKIVPTGEMTQGEFGALRVDDSKNFTNQSFVLTEGTPGKAAVPAQPSQSVRTQALNAIQSLTPDQVKAKGVGSSYMQKLLTDNKRGNMGANMRVMTMSGAMLAGVPFTGRRNDHSSGFNKNRGNKI